MKVKTKISNVQTKVFFSRKQRQSLRYKNQSELALYLINEFNRTIAGYWHIGKLLPTASANDPMANASIFVVVDIFHNKEIVFLENTGTVLNQEQNRVKNKTKEFCEIKNIKFTVYNEITVQRGFTALNLKNLYQDSGMEISVRDVLEVERLLRFRKSISVREIKQHISQNGSISSLIFHQVLITDLEKKVISDDTIVYCGANFDEFIREVKKGVASQFKNN